MTVTGGKEALDRSSFSTSRNLVLVACRKVMSIQYIIEKFQRGGPILNVAAKEGF